MASTERPNVLLICFDQWSGRLMGCAGHPAIMTPTLDQLAANGVRFTNCYSAAPTCIPARRGLMTGTTPQTHGDRRFIEDLPMYDHLPTLAQTFSDAGYQTYAVGKMHVYPQRDRIGFDDVILNEESRNHLGMSADDYQLYLAQEGYAGQEMTHGMCNNDYMTRPWHLPERLHPTNWTAREMCKAINRRDNRPALWYMSFNYPHPPLVPVDEYLHLYDNIDIPDAKIGDWAEDDDLPLLLRLLPGPPPAFNQEQLRRARQAFYAQCTYIDHQIRLVIGMLREAKLLDNTIVCLTGDHGDMLGDHHLYAKRVFFEDSAKVPFIIMPTKDDPHGLGDHRTDDRLTELRDIMPTLLEMCGIDTPNTVEGISVLSDERREYLFGEHGEGPLANRMLRSDRYKLIYYPFGNRFHLFDMIEDPDELHDLSKDPDYATIIAELVSAMIPHLHGGDEDWADGDQMVGVPNVDVSQFADHPMVRRAGRALNGQRGWKFM